MELANRNPEISLIFNQLQFRPSPQQFELLRSRLSTVEGVKSIEVHTDWLFRQQLVAVFQDTIAPHEMLRKMAGALRGRTPDPAAKIHGGEPVDDEATEYANSVDAAEVTV